MRAVHFFVQYEQRYKNVNSSAAPWTHRQLMVVELFLWLRKNNLTAAYQARNTLEEAGVSLLRSTNKRCPTEWKYREFRISCKALGGTQGYTLIRLKKCHKTDRTIFYSADGWWPKADCQRSDPQVPQSKEMGIFFISQVSYLSSIQQSSLGVIPKQLMQYFWIKAELLHFNHIFTVWFQILCRQRQNCKRLCQCLNTYGPGNAYHFFLCKHTESEMYFSLQNTIKR